MTVCSSMGAGVRLCRKAPDSPGLSLNVAKHPVGLRPHEVVRVHMNRHRHAQSSSVQPKRCRCSILSDHIVGRTAAVFGAVGVVHVLPQSRRADTDVLDAHVDFDAWDAHTCASCAQGKAKPPGISAVPRADVYVADDVHYPDRRPRAKCSVRTAYRNVKFAGGIDKSQLLSCPAWGPRLATSAERAAPMRRKAIGPRRARPRDGTEIARKPGPRVAATVRR